MTIPVQLEPPREFAFLDGQGFSIEDPPDVVVIRYYELGPEVGEEEKEFRMDLTAFDASEGRSP